MYFSHLEYTFLLEKPKNKEETINKNVISVTCKGYGENKSIILVNKICKFKMSRSKLKKTKTKNKMSRIEQDMLI